MSAEWSIDMKLAKRAAGLWRELAMKWDLLWPRLYSTILTARHEYGREGEITLNSPILEISPPDSTVSIPEKEWSLTLTMPEWDGNYYVEFKLEGKILDSGADF
jgi:hypothetical protein